ncbi:hypothetical protein [Dyella terrae]|uniref:hypothetical protein n=1 Tax=Dyella terrae TaxID=522259 RepID=UPI001EFE0527|nr:hypothetical protein [Dyella terrae]ULU23172.1 hypothetical protein DYST_00063 [Dyella terrae]
MTKAVLVSLGLTLVLMSTLATAKERNWQESTETETKLWVRDKSEGAPFEATFKVTKPDGSTSVAKAKSGQGGVAEVSFPQSFGLYGPMAHGNYRWEASVDGRIVATDEFGR